MDQICRNVVLQKDPKNSMDAASKQRGILKEYGNQRTHRIKKRHLYSIIFFW